MSKYGLERYTDADAPLFMFGCYPPQFNFKFSSVCNPFNRKRGVFTVICWAGTDASYLVKYDKEYYSFFTNLFLGRHEIKHIAMSEWIANDLESLGIPCFRHPVFVHNVDDYIPCPKGESIYMYRPDKDIYNGKGLYQEIKKRVPYGCIEVGVNKFDREKLMDAYRRSFIGLRFTEHDGMNHTGCELGLMGRRSIYNGKTPYSIPFDKDNIDGIIDAINEEFSKNNWERIAKETREYLDRGDNFLNTEYYDMCV